jgi:hypothetical protein
VSLFIFCVYGFVCLVLCVVGDSLNGFVCMVLEVCMLILLLNSLFFSLKNLNCMLILFIFRPRWRDINRHGQRRV